MVRAQLHPNSGASYLPTETNCKTSTDFTRIKSDLKVMLPPSNISKEMFKCVLHD